MYYYGKNSLILNEEIKMKCTAVIELMVKVTKCRYNNSYDKNCVKENELVLIRKEILVELRTVIDDSGEKELSIIKQKGNYIRKEDREVITFVDVMEELGEIRSFISIQPGKVNINRSGVITMNQQFLLGQVTECIYKHPFGRFHLEINTLSIEQKQLQDGEMGQTIIEYEGKLNGEHVRHHHLTLTYVEGEE